MTQAGQKYSIRVEYGHFIGLNKVVLAWRPPTGPRHDLLKVATVSQASVCRQLFHALFCGYTRAYACRCVDKAACIALFALLILLQG